MSQSNLQRRASITTFVSQIVFNGVTNVFAEKVPVIIMYESSRLTIQNQKIHWAQHADHFNRSDYLFHKSKKLINERFYVTTPDLVTNRIKNAQQFLVRSMCVTTKRLQLSKHKCCPDSTMSICACAYMHVHYI